MAVQYCLVPIEQVTINGTNYRGPEHFLWRFDETPATSINCRWSMKDYGTMDVAIVAGDMTPDQITQLQGYADSFVFDPDLNSNIGQPQLGNLSSYLENAFIPADWLNAGMSTREVLRTITGAFLFMQRLVGITGVSPLLWGITLNTQYGNLDQVYQDAILEALITLGYDTSFLTSNLTIRVLLKRAADEWGTRPILFGFTTL